MKALSRLLKLSGTNTMHEHSATTGAAAFSGRRCYTFQRLTRSTLKNFVFLRVTSLRLWQCWLSEMRPRR